MLLAKGIRDEINPALQLLAERSVLARFTKLEVYLKGVIKKLECCCLFFIFMEIRVKKKIIIRQKIKGIRRESTYRWVN